MSNAPIIIFAYNRPKHVARVIRSLKANPEFSTSPVTVYCDGPKSHDQEEAVALTRKAVHEANISQAKIVERDENFGLAKSIITGVSEHTEEYGRVIIAEDDLVFSKGALAYLNAGLDRYENEDKVMHVSAYMFPVQDELIEAFFYREATCWGWGTWKRAWQHFEPDAGKLLDIIDQKKLRSAYDCDDTMFFYAMLKKQRDGELDSWAIRWYTTMFLRGGLALHPAHSYVENLGFDGSGVHCNVDDRFIVRSISKSVSSWPTVIEESAPAFEAMKEYRRTTLMSKKRRVYQRLVQNVRASRFFK